MAEDGLKKGDTVSVLVFWSEVTGSLVYRDQIALNVTPWASCLLIDKGADDIETQPL